MILGVDWRRWREWPGRIAHLWRTSLQFRTVLITVALTLLAVLAAGFIVSFIVGNGLYQARLDQAYRDSARATTDAQKKLDASDATDPEAIDNLFLQVFGDVKNSSATGLVASFRVPGQGIDAAAPVGVSTFGSGKSVITKSLRKAVQASPRAVFAQSVALPNNDGSTRPGIVVGSQLQLPTAGSYELYIGYDLSDSEETLLFVQRTLLVVGLVLVLLIAAITYLVVRLVVTPIRLAAETSRRLADGDLEVRMPLANEDAFATLGRSFNGMADALQRQITQLATLSKLQQRFVSDVSHELRTPLTTIRLAGDVIYDQREDFPPATARTAELLHTQIERFDLLLSDLLEISRYDAGSVVLEPEPTNLVRLAEDAVDDMRPLAITNDSPLRLDAPGGYFEVEMDPRRVRRILRNLLGNAIEHGEGRPIVVTVDSNATALALGVRDYGLGMNANEVEHVFDRFWRADPSRKRTIGGTGLGLAISLEDATEHGGWLDVWSSPREGSHFRLTLPRVPGQPIEASPLPLTPVDAPRDPEGHLIGHELIGTRHGDDGDGDEGSEGRARRGAPKGRRGGRNGTRNVTEKHASKRAEKHDEKRAEKQSDKHGEKRAEKQSVKHGEKRAEKQSDKHGEKRAGGRGDKRIQEPGGRNGENHEGPDDDEREGTVKA
ncbi:MtrAB system histidine kinase MtrB [Humibacter albus]|uniref:MtrAB system histidine kinase MtrB n=1 Tax=Humibacter albus TaxID=427754 RepID=UPI0003B695AA|nr:MtrAB system histidine kinase MtrB [Humibacter albus]